MKTIAVVEMNDEGSVGIKEVAEGYVGTEKLDIYFKRCRSGGWRYSHSSDKFVHNGHTTDLTYSEKMFLMEALNTYERLHAQWEEERRLYWDLFNNNQEPRDPVQLELPFDKPKNGDTDASSKSTDSGTV